MHNLVNELLDAARIESGKLTLHKEPVDLVAYARDVADKNRQRANQKKQDIVFSHNSQSGQIILADPVRVQEIIDNLISNAIKYSPVGGSIGITVNSYSDSKGFDFVRFEVSDKGPGLTQEDKKKIFGKFQRLSAQPTGGESSTGLGLSIVKQLVELHNGKIWVESEFGQGSTFIAEFPVYTKQKVATKKKKARSDS
jgi:signal transduction histidine kinase